MIDICDFATGLSRQLYGLTMHSERPDHRMYEQWHPLGVVGVISAFNFPVAVWSWNVAIAAVCGDSSVWKPASGTPLTAIACIRIAEQVCRENGVDPAVFSLTVGPGRTVGERMLNDRRIPLVSATGSCRMGYRVASVVGERLGRTILELGGNNAIIVTPSANLELTLPAILFGAVGTAGQRCTSTRRIIVHRSVEKELTERLVRAYRDIQIGDPREASTLMGPLVTEGAVGDMMDAIAKLKEAGGKVLCGGEKLDGEAYPGGHYVTPCIAKAENHYQIVQDETFAPILYLISYGSEDATPAEAVAEMDEALAIHNGVPQGLSSSIFSDHMREIEYFLSHRGSDCGIANVNIGTSGAEIGGAFGGEKETGGGRESGSDAWKVYMRRQTNTINWSTDLPLAQGISFGGD
jgi:aldehyde dehydrogenase (NAD+)